MCRQNPDVGLERVMSLLVLGCGRGVTSYFVYSRRSQTDRSTETLDDEHPGRDPAHHRVRRRQGVVDVGPRDGRYRKHKESRLLIWSGLCAIGLTLPWD